MLHSHLCRTALLGAAVVLAIPASADDAPKSGAFSVKSSSKGSYHFLGIGDGSHLSIAEHTGIIDGEGILHGMTIHCIGIAETINAVTETPHGYCVDRDGAGDTIVFRTAYEKHSWFSSKSKGSGVAMLGTGKYKGVVASFTVACEASGPETGFTMECDGQGSYILPYAG
jgi:hypothetical protein